MAQNLLGGGGVYSGMLAGGGKKVGPLKTKPRTISGKKIDAAGAVKAVKGKANAGAPVPVPVTKMLGGLGPRRRY